MNPQFFFDALDYQARRKHCLPKCAQDTSISNNLLHQSFSIWPEPDFELLVLLSVGEDRTLAELQQTLEFVGKDLQPEDLQPWIARGLLVTLQQGEEPLRLHLSEAGRALVVQWLAFAKAAEMSALAGFSYEETQQFKLLLGKLIQHTNAELPEHWREENIWRDKNLWQPDE